MCSLDYLRNFLFSKQRIRYLSIFFFNTMIGFGVGRGQAPLSAMKQVCVCSLYILHFVFCLHSCCSRGEGRLYSEFWGKVLESFALTRPFLPPAILLHHSYISHWSISHINNTLFSTITLWFLSTDAKLNCLKTSPYTVVFSKLQLVVYYQCCILIGWAATRLYVTVHW